MSQAVQADPPALREPPPAVAVSPVPTASVATASVTTASVTTASVTGGSASPRRWWQQLWQSAVNGIVFAALGGLMYWGHHTGWKIPKFSEVRGVTWAGPDDWCTEHLVPESQCVECQASLLPRPKEFGWCAEHGVAECVQCHPELAQVKGEPRPPRYDTRAALRVITRPENNSKSTLHRGRVQFASAESLEKAGVDVDVVQERPMSDVILANGELMFDPTRVAHLATRVSGTIMQVHKTVGQTVEPGDILALIDAASVGQAKSALLHAVVQRQLRKTNLERMKVAASALSGRSVTEAEAAVQEAEIGYLSARQALVNLGFPFPADLDTRSVQEIADELRFLGLPTALTQELSKQTKTANLIPIRAVHGGVVVAVDAVAGEVVDPEDTLFTVADPTQLWLTLHVRQEDAALVSLGQSVRFHTDSAQQDASGVITWISPGIDERTRTVQVRVPIANPHSRLRDKTYGTGTIVLREEPYAIVVPKDAVHATPESTHVVFVRDRRFFEDGSPKVFHTRQVRLGARNETHVELIAGVLPGEVVATRGSAVILGQLLRSTLGAGCACHSR